MSRVSDLGDDEIVFLRLLSQGLTLEAIARELGVSERTVRRRSRETCDRLGVATPIEAVVRAVRARAI